LRKIHVIFVIFFWGNLRFLFGWIYYQFFFQNSKPGNSSVWTVTKLPSITAKEIGICIFKSQYKRMLGLCYIGPRDNLKFPLNRLFFFLLITWIKLTQLQTDHCNTPDDLFYIKFITNNRCCITDFCYDSYTRQQRCVARSSLTVVGFFIRHSLCSLPQQLHHEHIRVHRQMQCQQKVGNLIEQFKLPWILVLNEIGQRNGYL
jgi:hypothetical protein